MFSSALRDSREGQTENASRTTSHALDEVNRSTSSVNQPQSSAPSRQTSPGRTQKKRCSVDLFTTSKGVKRKVTWPENQRVAYIEDQTEREMQLVREYQETRATWKMLTTIEDAKSAAVCRKRGVQNYIRMHNIIERLQSELEEFLEEQLRRAIEVEPAMFKRMTTSKLYNHPITDADEAACDRQHELLDELMARCYQTRQSSCRFMSLFLNDEEKRHVGAKLHYRFEDYAELMAEPPERKFLPTRVVEAADIACADLMLAREVREEEKQRIINEAKEKRESHRKRKEERKEIRLARKRRREERAKLEKAKRREEHDPFHEASDVGDVREASTDDNISVSDESATFFSCGSSNDESEMGEFYPIGYDDDGNTIYRRKMPDSNELVANRKNSGTYGKQFRKSEADSFPMTLPTPVKVTQGDEALDMFEECPWENKIDNKRSKHKESHGKGNDGSKCSASCSDEDGANKRKNDIDNVKEMSSVHSDDSQFTKEMKQRNRKYHDENIMKDPRNLRTQFEELRNLDRGDEIRTGDVLSNSDTSTNVPIVLGDPVHEVVRVTPDNSSEKVYLLRKEIEGEQHRHQQPTPFASPKLGRSRCSSHVSHYHYYHSSYQKSQGSGSRFRSPREPPRARHSVLGVELPRKYHVRDPSKMYGHQIESLCDPLATPARGRAASKQRPFFKVDGDDINPVSSLKTNSPGRVKLGVYFVEPNETSKIPYLNNEALNQRLHIQDVPKQSRVAAWREQQQLNGSSPHPVPEHYEE
eukprot:Tbor_TRINITY_DN696_c0_g1::TRINITY_DN696_c0_g1_i1::g.1567::m.1567